MSNDELVSKIIMWRSELEKQGTNMGVMSVFDSMCAYLGEQQRMINNHKQSTIDGKIKGLGTVKITKG